MAEEYEHVVYDEEGNIIPPHLIPKPQTAQDFDGVSDEEREKLFSTLDPDPRDVLGIPRKKETEDDN